MKLKKTFIIVLLIVGFIIAGFGALGIYDAMQCKKWIKVKGHIISAIVSDMTESPKEVHSETSIPDVVYEYKYKDQTYFSQSISYFPDSIFTLQNSYYADSEDAVLLFLKQYPINSEVDVYVNPDDPEASILDPSVKLPIFFTLIFGLLLIYFAIHIALFGDRSFNVKQQKTKGA